MSLASGTFASVAVGSHVSSSNPPSPRGGLVPAPTTSSAPLLAVPRPRLERTPRTLFFTRSGSANNVSASANANLTASALSLVESSRLLRQLDRVLARSATVWGARAPLYNKSLPRSAVSLETHVLTLHVWQQRRDREPLLCGVAAVPVQHLHRVGSGCVARIKLSVADKKGKVRVPVCSDFVSLDDGSSGEAEPLIVLDYTLHEQVILPDECYAPLASLLLDDAAWTLARLLEQLLREVAVPSVAPALSQLLCAAGDSTRTSYLDTWLEREIRSATDVGTLFRGDSLGARVFEHVLHSLGAPLLQATLSSHVQRIVREDPTCELSESKLEPGAKLRDHLNVFVSEFSAITRSIFLAHAALPDALCRTFATLTRLVTARFPTKPEAPVTAACAFLFLRFFVPALLAPAQFGLFIGEIPARQASTLNALARALQKLANLNLFEKEREPHLHLLNDVLLDTQRDLSIYVGRLVERSFASPSAPSTSSSSSSSSSASASVPVLVANVSSTVTEDEEGPDAAAALSSLLNVFDAHTAWWSQRLDLPTSTLTERDSVAALLRLVPVLKETELRVADAYLDLQQPSASSPVTHFKYAEETLEDELRHSPALFALLDERLRALPHERSALHFLAEHAHYMRLPLALRRTKVQELATAYLEHGSTQAPRLGLARDVRVQVLARVSAGEAHVHTLREAQRHCVTVLAPHVYDALRSGEAALPAVSAKQIAKQLKRESSRLASAVAFFLAPSLSAASAGLGPAGPAAAGVAGLSSSPKLKKLNLFEDWLASTSQRASVAEVCARVIVAERDPALLAHTLRALSAYDSGATLSAFCDRLFGHALRLGQDQDQDESQRLRTLLSSDALPTWAWNVACRTWAAPWLRATLGAEVSRVLSSLLAPGSIGLELTNATPQGLDEAEAARALVHVAATRLLDTLLSGVEAPLALRALTASWYSQLRSHFFRASEAELSLVPAAWLLHKLRASVLLVERATPSQVRALHAVALAVESLLDVDVSVTTVDRRIHRSLSDRFAQPLAQWTKRLVATRVSVSEAAREVAIDAEAVRADVSELAHALRGHHQVLAELTDSKTFAQLQESFGDQIESRKEFTFHQKQMAEWSTTDVCDWLDSLGMGEYGSQFRDHEVFGTVLATMEVEDLAALGVTKLGHQKRILRQREDADKVALSGSSSSTSLNIADWRTKGTLEWETVDISAWMEQTGFGEYAGSVTSAIKTGSRLLEVEQADLSFLGISKLGHQKRFLSKIAELYQQSSESSQSQGPEFHRKETCMWSVHDVSQWLRSLELSEYEAAFTAAKVDGPRLLALEAADLSVLGVKKLGHQKRLISQRAQYAVQVILEGSTSSGDSLSKETRSAVSGLPTFPDKHVKHWNVNEVAQWLESIELGELCDQFRDNDISGPRLLELDVSGLMQIGFSKIGHQKKILARRAVHLPLASRNSRSNLLTTSSFAASSSQAAKVALVGDPRLSRSAPSFTKGPDLPDSSSRSSTRPSLRDSPSQKRQ